MLKLSRSAESLTQLGKSRVGVVNDNKAGHDNKVDNKVDDEVGKKGQNLSKSENLSKSKKTELGFFISRAQMTFTKLKQAFIKAPTLHHFNLERHIWVETDASGFAISEVFNHSTLDDLG